MNRRDTGHHPSQAIGQAVGPTLGAGKNDALARSVSLQQVNQKLDLPIVVHRNVKLIDGLDRGFIL